MHGLFIDDPKLNFSSSHFIVDHDKCERLHGHNYQVKIELLGEPRENFMVIDFKVAKDKILEICDRLDHRILLPGSSPSLEIKNNGEQIEVRSPEKFYSFPKRDCVILPIPATTAEELAKQIFSELKKTLPELGKVYVAESEGSTAFYSES
jgi:6-pyruvoyltetrahydropterin/6-carboxytetrahydropterin synthase